MPYVDGAPDIANIEDDLITREQLAELFGISVATLDKWRWGREGKPIMPFVRLGTRVMFSKTQMIWWLNQYQKQLDPYLEDRKQRKKEGQLVGRPRQ